VVSLGIDIEVSPQVKLHNPC